MIRPLRNALRTAVFSVALGLGLCSAQTTAPARSGAPDLSKDPTLYLVGYAHLDTEYRWTYVHTIDQFIPATLRGNFTLLDRYPRFIFNFSGANRYRMAKEYYPADYQKLKQYIAAGQWFPSGSSMEENDVNVPAAESIIRQVLYGGEYFRNEFGKSSAEYMLPDCFGFPASLPSLLAHCGIKGFSTQKLTWNSAAGIPFNVGVWEGPDGRGVIGALNAGAYTSRVSDDLSRNNTWLQRIQKNGQTSGVFADYTNYGVGDNGGPLTESSVQLMEKSVAGNGPVRVISATAEQMFLDITPEQRVRLPRYKGDLLLTDHSAGSITSQAYMKRWNHKNELLADAAERASVLAGLLGAATYPQQRLNNAWTLVMGGQFHDILPGTSIAQAYDYAWNDQILALNQFAGVVQSAAGAIASGLDTQNRGACVVVYNPLSVARQDVVDATVRLPSAQAIRVIGPDGQETPSQIVGREGDSLHVLFVASMPPVGFSAFDIQPAPAATAAPSELKVSESSLENARYRVKLDNNGDVAGIFDKQAQREMLSSPIRLAFVTERPARYPAWNMDWKDQQTPPRGYFAPPARVRVIENGPARIAVQVQRDAEDSHVAQIIRLSAGDAGNRVEFADTLDWRAKACCLKAVFPLSVANPLATYNWEVGTIQRGNNDPKKYEVPSHQWFDLTDTRGDYGVTVLSDCKYGSDKPDDKTLRLTLVYTPDASCAPRNFDQSTQDWGRHEIAYGLAGHVGDWRGAKTDWQALRLSQPLIAFPSPGHAGSLGKSLSLMNVSNDRVRVLAIKKAERSDEVIVRLVELDGKPAGDVRIAFASPIASAREVDGQERPIGSATVSQGQLVMDFTPYQLRTFAVKLADPPAKLARTTWQALELPYDRCVTSRDGAKSPAGFDAQSRCLPAEMLSPDIAYAGVHFKLAGATEGQPNALTCRGQSIALPAGKFNRLYILAAADGDQKATFTLDGQSIDVTVQDWGGFIGQWDKRLWRAPITPRPAPAPSRDQGIPPVGAPAARVASRAAEGPGSIFYPQPPAIPTQEYAGLAPAYAKRSPVAWFASHRHNSDGANEPYGYCYLFAYALDRPQGARELKLPSNQQIRILAITAADESPALGEGGPLYDTLQRAAE